MREPVPRVDRVPVVRLPVLRVPVLRVPVLPVPVPLLPFFADAVRPPDPRFVPADEPGPPLLERLAAAPDDLALLVPLFVAFVPERVERDLVEAVPVEREVVLREAAERDLPVRAAPLRPVAPAPPASPSSPLHLPDITRCAASATASAISVPSRDALEATLLAACCAVSAASRPASRIFRLAAGLALIAAAAAASPAASISRLIAAFAILSTVLSFEVVREFEDCGFEDCDFEERVGPFELFRLVDLAIVNLPSVAIKDTSEA